MTESRTPGQREAARQLRDAVARIADAVHQSVCDITGSDGHGLAGAYALAGARTASMFGLDLVPQGGKLHVTAKTRIHHIGAWAWMAARPGGTTPAGIEVADFGMRHIQRRITEAGITWDIEPVPLWYCGPVHDLASFGIRFEAEEGSREAIETIIDAGITVQIVGKAMQILGGAGDGGTT